MTTARSVEIRGKIEKVIERGQVVTASLNQIKRSQVVVRDINAHSNQLSQLLNEPNLTVEGLTDYVSNYLETIKLQLQRVLQSFLKPILFISLAGCLLTGQL